VARRHGLELPVEGAELPVLAGGRPVARFVLVPTPGAGASTHARLAAVVIADQVGLTLSQDLSREPVGSWSGWSATVDRISRPKTSTVTPSPLATDDGTQANAIDESRK
jgi:hypothetical protein